MKLLVSKWLAVAKADLEMANLALKHKKFLFVAYHSQQSVEKTLKAYYILSEKQQPPYIHDLVRLSNLVGIFEQNSNLSDKPILEELNVYYISARYPSYKMDVAKNLTLEKANEFIRLAGKIFKWVKGKVK